jgi:hypothetical protein
MRTILTAIAIATTSLPALAADCVYVNDEGDRATVGFAQLTIQNVDGSKWSCPSEGMGTEIPWTDATCDSGFEGAYRFAPSKAGGKVNDLLIFKNDVWYATCKP